MEHGIEVRGCYDCPMGLHFAVVVMGLLLVLVFVVQSKFQFHHSHVVDVL